ncbi:MAG: CoA ester lyase [Xanthobacteraceae bacterium]|nr:CoA ester lyase [Xanthobacteraceae bacterium]
MTTRPRRSVLYMPGSNARALEKAKNLLCDAIILDLEDSIAPDAKVAARQQVADAVKAGGFGAREVIVRINALDTQWWIDDLTAAANARPDAILIPKISKPSDLEEVSSHLVGVAADEGIKLWAMVETPLGVLNAGAIAALAAAPRSRLACFVMGTNDLAKETQANLVPGRFPMLPWLSHCVLAARAHGLDILDGVYNDIADIEGLRRECAQGDDMGFDGKTLIHPNQIEPCNAAFSPTPREIELAHRIIAAFDLPENRSKGVVQVGGRMVERLHAQMARRTVAIAEAIEKRSRP